MSCPRKMKKEKFKVFLIILCCFFITTIYIIYSQCLKPSINYYKILEEHPEIVEKNDTRFILLFTDFFEVKNWKLPTSTVGSNYLAENHCEVTKCVFTTEKSLLEEYHLYDALIFHIAEPWAYSIFNKVPSERMGSQIYIAASMESPAHTKHLLERDHDFFNWTMTYRLDSDIIWNYNSFIDIELNRFISPSNKPVWKDYHQEFHNKSMLELVERKTKMAAWFVSHCGVISGRDELGKDLQRFINVDIYGKCGNFSCPHHSEKCRTMLNDDYKFYLAFENSLCKDYVTEKLFTVMQQNIVPVVFGGADYNKFAPPHSYINANDFNTTKDLAIYLSFLDKNPKEYIKYFWWKLHYKIGSPDWRCDVCKKLHDPVLSTKLQVYKSIKDWWYNDACLLKPKIQF